MDKVYKSDVWGGEAHVYTVGGDPVTVRGEPMVQLPHGPIVPASGFHATRADAKRAAAARLDEIRARLAGQAEQLRAEADLEEAQA